MFPFAASASAYPFACDTPVAGASPVTACGAVPLAIQVQTLPAPSTAMPEPFTPAHTVVTLARPATCEGAFPGVQLQTLPEASTPSAESSAAAEMPTIP